MARIRTLLVMAVGALAVVGCGAQRGYSRADTERLTRVCDQASAIPMTPGIRREVCGTAVTCIERRIPYATFVAHREDYRLGAATASACERQALASTPIRLTPAVAPHLTTPDEQAAAQVAVTYLNAFMGGDWQMACATRAPADQHQIAQATGSCPRAMALAAARLGGVAVARLLFRGTTVTGARRHGRLIGIHLYAAAHGAFKLAAVNIGGHWRLIDIPDAAIP